MGRKQFGPCWHTTIHTPPRLRAIPYRSPLPGQKQKKQKKKKNKKKNQPLTNPEPWQWKGGAPFFLSKCCLIFGFQVVRCEGAFFFVFWCYFSSLAFSPGPSQKIPFEHLSDALWKSFHKRTVLQHLVWQRQWIGNNMPPFFWLSLGYRPSRDSCFISDRTGASCCFFFGGGGFSLCVFFSLLSLGLHGFILFPILGVDRAGLGDRFWCFDRQPPEKSVEDLPLMRIFFVRLWWLLLADLKRSEGIASRRPGEPPPHPRLLFCFRCFDFCFLFWC